MASDSHRRAGIAQLVEQATENRRVPSSNLGPGIASFQASLQTGASSRGLSLLFLPLPLPDRLRRGKQGGLDIGHEALQPTLLGLPEGEMSGDGSGVTQIHKQGHLLGTEAEQMLVSAMGDLQGPDSG